MPNLRRLSLAVSVLLCSLVPLAAHAQAPEPQIHPQPGPAKITLGHQLTLQLPEEHVFIKGSEAKPMLEKSGNFFGDGFLGVVIPKDNEKQKWWVAIEYADEGYIKDDEKLDADAILKSIKEGNDEANEVRKEKGIPELIVDGWSDPPRYDRAQHHLVWALIGHDTEGKSINFNTRVLGRKGFVSINLITDPSTLTADKPEVQKLLAATSFDQGARYADFDEKKGDKVAAYGLAALVAGGAGVTALKVAKLGFLAKFGKVLIGLLVALKKGIVVILLAIGAFLKKLFGGKSEEKPPEPPAAPPAV